MAMYVENMDTNIREILDRCREAESVQSQFILYDGTLVTMIHQKVAVSQGTPEVIPEIPLKLGLISGEMSRFEILQALALSDEKPFREHYQRVATTAGLVETTYPDTPQNLRQKYRITKRGKAAIHAKNRRRNV